ncbi:glutamate-1-semialdehyde 2,1-aminomutase [Pleurocapsa sp. FMAR1]|uniref:glutamate-1-semialdehyde 2,1-aminomutase n=1 Tax=Pleurocapsa sp. FMAR1 TaxID=3040204 RepID=UPI0029C81437|nr:glutamate-1-semialdehyde 2,1-aminomutase [Pleurocapsa sp. FMAR1]
MINQKEKYISNFSRSEELKQKSHQLIPGGAHTYAKGDDQYPELAPGFLVKGKGCHVWDVDDNEYIEYGMGLRAVTLGHGYESVVKAAYRQMLLGINFTRPAPIEIECAEQFLSLIEGAEMVKFAKNGSDATTAAIKLARAYTGKDMVAVCADHPFFSTDDWFIGSRDMNAGIPEAIQNLTVKFKYNDLESIKALFTKYPNRFACLIMEAETLITPTHNFLHEAKRICHENGALFILDEIITGFRWDLGGAQKVHQIVPDLSTFGKGMGNGFSIAALAGKREIMELGGIQHDRERVFLLSTTFGAETHSLAAAMEVMRIYQEENVVEYLDRQGKKLIEGINQVIATRQLEEYFSVAGKPCNLIYVTKDGDKERSQAFRTLFLQEIIKRGIIAPSLVVSFSHRDEDIQRTIEAIAEALDVYHQALEEGVEKYLVGRTVQPVFRKFN